MKGGAIVTRLGPKVRRGEEAPVTETLAAAGMPILRTIHGHGLMEGGSFVWLNAETAVIGRSSRVNEEGARQVEEVLRACCTADWEAALRCASMSTNWSFMNSIWSLAG